MSQPEGAGAYALRLATAADAEGVAAIYAPIVRDTVISFEFEAPTAAEMQRRIESTLTTLPWLVAEGAGSVLGYAYAGKHRERAAYQWSVDTSVYVAADARRLGVARRLYTALFAILVDLGYYNAFAGVTLPNAASVGFHESMGFRPVGVYHDVGYKFGAWHDVGWWERPLRDRAVDPLPPRRMQGYMRSDLFRQRIRGQ